MDRYLYLQWKVCKFNRGQRIRWWALNNLVIQIKCYKIMISIKYTTGMAFPSTLLPRQRYLWDKSTHMVFSHYIVRYVTLLHYIPWIQSQSRWLQNVVQISQKRLVQRDNKGWKDFIHIIITVIRWHPWHSSFAKENVCDNELPFWICSEAQTMNNM
jgi:hypothetical protein